jgi:nitrate reductase (NAD(P)H)
MEEDILCKQELDSFAEGNIGRCRLVYTLTQPSDGWGGRRGRISEGLIREHVVPGEEAMVLVCGPEALEESVRRILLAQGWREEDLVFF